MKQENDARAYIELMRYSQLIMAISSHSSYNLKQYEKEKNLNQRRLKNAITKMEELKPKLIKQYNEMKKQHVHKQSSIPQPTRNANDDMKQTKSENDGDCPNCQQPITDQDFANSNFIITIGEPLRHKQCPERKRKKKKKNKKKKNKKNDGDEWEIIDVRPTTLESISKTPSSAIKYQQLLQV